MTITRREAIPPLPSFLPLVQKPGRYVGTEFHAVHKDPRAVTCRAVLLFPDLYEIGMSHLGLEILYHILNGREDIWAERAYAPALDLERVLRRQGLALTSLESGTPLAAFECSHHVGVGRHHGVDGRPSA